MNDSAQPVAATMEAVHELIRTLEATVLGQEAGVRGLMAVYLAGGHALLEGVPGVGKTLLARSLAAALGLPFQRLQFTPDLMPADVVGSSVFSPASGRFEVHRGPLFTSLLMADELNRTPPKTQSALLEAMQEGQVSIDGSSHALPEEFFVVATLNPVEFEGVYPLPEAQLDRFLARLRMEPPGAEQRLTILRAGATGSLSGWGEAVRAPIAATVDATTARALRGAARAVHVRDDLLVYIGALAEYLAGAPQVELGVSPRGALALLALARGTALAAGRDYAVPDDVRGSLEACWGHRLLLTAEAELEGHDATTVLRAAADVVPAPH